MNHSFNEAIAKECGVEGAVLIHNLYFWIQKNKANNRHFYDGKHWTYNSVSAFTELFPYWTKRQIERILKNLEKNGFIITGNYNKSAYDQTKWYALADTVNSIYANGEIETRKHVNQIHQTRKPIPDINTDINTDSNTDINTDIFATIGGKKVSLEEIKRYCNERNNGINAEHFFDYYQSKNWMIGKNKMKCWKSAVRTWEKNKKQSSSKKTKAPIQKLLGLFKQHLPNNPAPNEIFNGGDGLINYAWTNIGETINTSDGIRYYDPNNEKEGLKFWDWLFCLASQSEKINGDSFKSFAWIMDINNVQEILSQKYHMGMAS